MAGSSEQSLTDPASMSAAVSGYKSEINNANSYLETEHGRSLISAILDDCLYNIISDTVLSAHRQEKQERMQSAAIVAQQAKDNAKNDASPGDEVQRTITTPGAYIDENDKIFLHDNPLRTTPEVLCPKCRLPRLLHPTTGKGSRPQDPSKEYCKNEPYVNKDGFDIYGKSLNPERPTKKKSANKKEKAEDGSGSDSREGSPAANGKDKDKNKEKVQSVPSGKCPYCPRYMSFLRIAQHMDRCREGPHGRKAKSATDGKVQSGTPQASSRASTPKPSTLATTVGSGAPSSVGAGAGVNGKKRKLEKSDDEDGETTPVRKKKIMFTKKDKDGKPKVLDPKIQRVKSGDKRPPGADGDSK